MYGCKVISIDYISERRKTSENEKMNLYGFPLWSSYVITFIMKDLLKRLRNNFLGLAPQILG